MSRTRIQSSLAGPMVDAGVAGRQRSAERGPESNGRRSVSTPGPGEREGVPQSVRPTGRASRWSRPIVVAVLYLCLYWLLDRFTTYSQIWPSLVLLYMPTGLTFALLLGMGLKYAPVA